MMQNTRLMSVLLSGLVSVSTAYASDIVSPIPVVPASQVKVDLPSPPNDHPASQKVIGLNESPRVKMTPGVNEVIPVAINHLNRIVTPYENPTITTSSPATTEVRENVIYIGTNQEAPLTLFITEDGSEEMALSLTLIPKRIPPREVFLSIQNGANSITPVASTRKAEAWEKAQPYIATIEQVFKTIALGGTPPGYTLDQKPVGELPTCRQTGIDFSFIHGQTVTGHSIRVHIGTATNSSDQLIEIAEETCGDWDVSAVAAFPTNVLTPGQKTEIYVAKKKNFRQEIKVNRPSLVGG